MSDIETWLNTSLPVYNNLTKIFVSITESLLVNKKIDYLSVTGRTKTIEKIREKINRKFYQTPKTQLTDISGVRVILFFESDVDKVCKLIEESFEIDKKNSLNKDSLLSTNQVGYRSVHLVCDLGKIRTSLPEFSCFKGMKCEFQIRTVLQHAWAELAHDRNYKFSGRLPLEMERKLYLYAGMLEITDKGLDELSHQIDKYVVNIVSETVRGNLNIEINSLSLEEFIREWSNRNHFELEEHVSKDNYLTLIEELNCFDITTLEQLNKIIPPKYVKIANKNKYSSNIYGLVRDWMLIHDYEKYRDKCWNRKWFGISASGDKATINLFSELLGEELANEVFEVFGIPENDEA